MTRAELYVALLACVPPPKVEQRDSDYGDLDQVLEWDLGNSTTARVTIPPTGAGEPTYEVALPRACSISGVATGDGESLWLALEHAGIRRGKR